MPEHVMHARAVLFDFDGVLVDSAAEVERAWGQWAGEYGLDPAMVLAHAHGVATVDTVRALLPDLDAAAEAARIEEREIAYAHRVSAYPGADTLLADLPEGSWAIVTSGTHSLAAARLDAIGLPVPPVFVTADDVGAGKPAPDPYLLAARRLDVPPDQCVVVEDSPAGVLAGRSAGMPVIAVLTTHDAAQLRGQRPGAVSVEPGAAKVDDPTIIVDDVAAIRVIAGNDGRLRIVTSATRRGEPDDAAR